MRLRFLITVPLVPFPARLLFLEQLPEPALGTVNFSDRPLFAAAFARSCASAQASEPAIRTRRRHVISIEDG